MRLAGPDGPFWVVLSCGGSLILSERVGISTPVGSEIKALRLGFCNRPRFTPASILLKNLRNSGFQLPRLH